MSLSETLKLYGAEWMKQGLTNRQALAKAKDLIETDFTSQGPAEAHRP